MYLPSLIRFLTKFIFISAVILFLARLIFYITFDSDGLSLNFAEIIQAFYLGLRFDLRIIVLFVLPLYFFAWFKYINPFKFKYARIFWLFYLSLVFIVVLIFYSLDFGHFAYLQQRLDFSATRFLSNFVISLEMVWQSYPVVWIIIGWVGATILFIYFTNNLFLSVGRQKINNLGFFKTFFIVLLSFCLLLLAVHSKFSQYPLRWSDAVFSKNPFATSLSYNPMHYFFDTWKNGKVSYNIDDVKKYYHMMADFLHIKDKNQQKLNFRRFVKPVNYLANKPNIVVIILESFASYKSSLSGNPLDPSPHVAKIAKSGWYFNNFYTPSTGTARSIYSTINSIPDVEINGTSSRNPLIVRQRNALSDFTDYHKSYFIGGSASWGNIRGMLSSVDNLKIYEEDFYKAKRADVWGVSDIDLFTEAHATMATQKQPFISFIQTSGNHRPYTIPANNYGFKARNDLNDKDLQKYGFESAKEYNSFRFMDHSVGHFIELAKKSSYYKNTIFVLYGDHGISGFVGSHIKNNKAQTQLDLGSLNVPFIIFSPLIKTAKKFDKIVSEVDVVPTIASLANVSYLQTGIGRDMLDKSFDDKRVAFTIKHNSNPTIGLITDKFYYTIRVDGTNSALFDYRGEGSTQDMQEQNKEKARYLKELVFAIYKTSAYIPYFNSKDKR
jgi:phosphoglycerol transferase MdoB-like AlkP superfamily enzyme